MQKILIMFLITGFVFGTELVTKEQKESYSIGASTGGYLSNQLYNQSQMGVKYDINLVIEGFIDALKKQQKLNEEQILALLNQRAETLNEIVKKNKKSLLDKNLKIQEEFLAKNLKNSKIKSTKSGLQYEILKDTKGEKPKLENVVLVNYKAYLYDGKVFDETKKPVHLSLVNIIEGLSEGLELMSVGSKYKFIIPSKLAYGDEGFGDIAPGSAVIFETELLKIFKPGELADVAKQLSESEIKSFHDLN